jgi:hypothetical protein
MVFCIPIKFVKNIGGLHLDIPESSVESDAHGDAGTGLEEPVDFVEYSTNPLSNANIAKLKQKQISSSENIVFLNRAADLLLLFRFTWIIVGSVIVFRQCHQMSTTVFGSIFNQVVISGLIAYWTYFLHGVVYWQREVEH